MHLFVCVYIRRCACSCLNFKRFMFLKHRSVKSGCSLSLELHECKLIDFSEAVPFQNNITERKIRPEVII